MATPSHYIDMRAQIRANILLIRPDVSEADVVTSLKGTQWRAILIYVKDGFRFYCHTKEHATAEEAMRVLLEDTSRAVYYEMSLKQVID